MRTDGGSKVRIIIGSIIGVGSFVCVLAFIWWMWAKYHKRQVQPSSRYYGRYFETQGAISGKASDTCAWLVV